jgi:phosphomannomutase
MARNHSLKIGVSGIRGVVGEFLTPALACQFARAFGTYVRGGRVVMGRDTRASGPMLEHAIACGLLSAGCEIVRVGILPTPTIQIYVAETGSSGGVAVTASHNPAEYNALKLFNREGLFFNGYERAELLDLYHQGVFREVANEEIRGVKEDLAAPPKLHIARVLQHVDAGRVRNRKFTVALDAVNGAGSLMTPSFLRETLGCEVHAISTDPDKPFPREPEPRQDTLSDLSRLVRASGAQIGFGLDPDGDRLAALDETGRALDPDDVLALAVDIALRRHKGNVVVNLTTSSAIDDIAAAHGCRVYRSPVGEANVVELMQATGAVIGGEGSSGGIIFPAVHLCRDSFMGIGFLLDRMAETGLPLSALTAALPHYYRRAGKREIGHGVLGPLMQDLEQAFPAAATDRSDGLKLAFPDAWIHVRASNTEPLLRIAVEAKSEDRLEELWQRTMGLLT